MDWQREWGKDKGGIMELNYTIYRYDADRNAVIMTDMDGRELVIECDKAEANGAVRRCVLIKIGTRRACKLCKFRVEAGRIAEICGSNGGV